MNLPFHAVPALSRPCDLAPGGPGSYVVRQALRTRRPRLARSRRLAGEDVLATPAGCTDQ
ncbi:predicted protein [Streptomyces viridochromogenes DSM 40736]|uniref:Predicted protein n=1 Tax=Streptomyces viridochromogenes (strain DSM 40736 / JCM 4977 / BCRC 1201 / Tue 494) TaxID=591159 RepID=D9X8G4_STRVT|nr:predicted protein [Streptomyces viridochromogenes DSM 40736]